MSVAEIHAGSDAELTKPSMRQTICPQCRRPVLAVHETQSTRTYVHALAGRAHNVIFGCTVSTLSLPKRAADEPTAREAEKNRA